MPLDAGARSTGARSELAESPDAAGATERVVGTSASIHRLAVMEDSQEPSAGRRSRLPLGRSAVRQAEADAHEPFPQLRRAKEDSLRDLLQRKPGQKHYRRSLKTYLEADDALQRAIILRLGLDFRA